jgi:hypothetical protein
MEWIEVDNPKKACSDILSQDSNFKVFRLTILFAIIRRSLSQTAGQ